MEIFPLFQSLLIIIIKMEEKMKKFLLSIFLLLFILTMTVENDDTYKRGSIKPTLENINQNHFLL